MERRELLKVLIAGPVAAQAGAHQHPAGHPKPAAPAPYQPRFFTAGQYELLDALCETILPADSEGGGAHDAGVAIFIDTRAVHSTPEQQEFWRRGLAEIDEASVQQTASNFVALDARGRLDFLARLLENERSPASAMERFTVRLKAMTIEGYCYSKTGMAYFGYRGNSVRDNFPGCTHDEHKRL